MDCYKFAGACACCDSAAADRGETYILSEARKTAMIFITAGSLKGKSGTFGYSFIRKIGNHKNRTAQCRQRKRGFLLHTAGFRKRFIHAGLEGAKKRSDIF